MEIYESGLMAIELMNNSIERVEVETIDGRDIVAVGIIDNYVGVAIDTTVFLARLDNTIDLGELLVTLQRLEPHHEMYRAALSMFVPYAVSIFFSLINQ